jgi:FkbM family methyltransferase
MENSLFGLFKKSVALSKGSPLQKLIKVPQRIFFSKALEFICLLFKRSCKIQVKTFWKDKMVVIIPEAVSLSVCQYGYTEEGLTDIVLNKLKPGMIFFDIGAHFGYFSLLASLVVGNGGQVHSFEPTLTSFNILKENISGKKNVFLNNCAVFSEKKTIFFNDYGLRYAAFNSLFTPRLPQNELPGIKNKTYAVECIPIDSYVEANGVLPDFVKIDAESAEYQILQGMEKTIKKCSPMITVEVGDLTQGVTLSRNIIEFLVSKDYQPYEYKEGRIELHVVKDGLYKYDNLLFLPRE